MTYRNRKHLNLLHDVPCMCRFTHRCQGPSVPMHSNALATGRGAGFKAPDWAVAAGCNEGHDYIDGRKGGWTLEEKRSEWLLAFYRTQDWLFENEKLVVNKEAA